MLSFLDLYILHLILSLCSGLVVEKWYEQQIDHFNFGTNGTFSQRYFVNDSFWTPQSNDPIFVYAGNEANILKFVNASGFMFDIAPEFSAMVVFIEHRYYGESFPFKESKSYYDHDKIGYLTVEQALADFVEVIYHICETRVGVRQCTYDHPVIVFGGSYGANLAMWLRFKYPNVFAGAIASSQTPLKHLLRETNGFWRIVTDVYRNASSECPKLLHEGFLLLQANKDPNQIKDALGLCEVTNWENIYGWIVDGIETMVQYGYPYPTSFYNPVPAYPFMVACAGAIIPWGPGTPLGALRSVVNTYYNYTGQAGSCFNLGDSVEEDTTGISWSYQTCTEVWQPMKMDGVTDMFLPSTPNEEELIANCEKRWGVTPRKNWEEETLWGLNIESGSNVFITNGQFDPWRAAGIQKQFPSSKDIIVRTIENGAHHYDLRGSNRWDPQSVIDVRNEERKYISSWIRARVKAKTEL